MKNKIFIKRMKQVKQTCMYNVGLILEFQLGPFLLDLSCFSWPTYSNSEEFEKKKKNCLWNQVNGL